MGQQNSYLTVIGVHNWDAFDHVSHTPYLLLDNYCVCVFGCVCMHPGVCLHWLTKPA